MAVECRQPPGGLLHHSDRRSQYTSEVYKQALDRLHAVQSMSEKGECWDNAVQESFFATLKTELELGKAQWGRAQTRTEVFEWIEVFYNRQRRHSALGYRSPAAFEEQAPIPN
ncbi:integrase core domain-containing protein [Deinococcus marmoris]